MFLHFSKKLSFDHVLCCTKYHGSICSRFIFFLVLLGAISLCSDFSSQFLFVPLAIILGHYQSVSQAQVIYKLSVYLFVQAVTYTVWNCGTTFEAVIFIFGNQLYSSSSVTTSSYYDSPSNIVMMSSGQTERHGLSEKEEFEYLLMSVSNSKQPIEQYRCFVSYASK